MNQERISSYQVAMMLIGFLLGSAIAANGILTAKQDAWLSFLIGWGAGFPLFFLTIGIALLHPHRSLVGILVDCFGNAAGKAVSLVFMAYFIILAALIASNFGFYSTTTNYPETPILFFLVCIVTAACFCLLGGLETLGRACEIMMVLTILNILFSLFILIPEFRFAFLKPYLGNGMGPVLKYAFTRAMIPFSEVFLLLMIFPNVNDMKKAVRSSWLGFILAGLILLSVAFRNLLVLGSDFGSREIFPTFEVFKMPSLPISAETLFDINAALTIVIKVSLFLFGASKGIAEVFGIQKYRKLIVPIAAVMVVLSYYLQKKVTDMLFVATHVVPVTHFVFFAVLPLIIFIVSLVKKPSPARNRAQQ